jgi:CRP/FNR family transcriptional regulator, cyclic AMP receptor protein
MSGRAQAAQSTPEIRAWPRRSPSRLTPESSGRAPAECASFPLCNLLREDPELAGAVPEPRRGEALDRCTAHVMRITAPDSMATALLPTGGVGLLILDGLLVRKVWVDGRSGAELLGEGDPLAPITGPDRSMLPVRTGWSVLEPLRVAMLDARFVEHQLRRYPELALALAARAAQRSQNMSVSLAIVSQPRVETRLLMLLWHLAERWGRVRAGAIVVPLRLTHALLAELVAARRPSVTTALASLADQGLIRHTRGTWLLFGEPPGDGAALGVLHTGNGQQHAHAGDHCR